jgi:hypothetical protein
MKPCKTGSDRTADAEPAKSQPAESGIDPLDEAAEASFPASDPPAFTGAAGSPSKKSAPEIVVPPLTKRRAK